MKDQLRPIADLHTHTIYSTHAYSTVTENAKAAADRGLLAIAMTDHSLSTPEPGHHWHFVNMRILPPSIAGVRVLHGVEANVLDGDGTLDMSVELLDKMELVIASMHNSIMKPCTVEENTQAWLTVAANPRVDIIGHCGTPNFRFDYERVIPEFGRYGKVVEINEGTFRVRSDSAENCRQIALLCKQHGVHISVNSDAHYHDHIGRYEKSLAMLQEIDFPEELIVNSSRERLEAYLKTKNLTL